MTSTVVQEAPIVDICADFSDADGSNDCSGNDCAIQEERNDEKDTTTLPIPDISGDSGNAKEEEEGGPSFDDDFDSFLSQYDKDAPPSSSSSTSSNEEAENAGAATTTSSPACCEIGDQGDVGKKGDLLGEKGDKTIDPAINNLIPDASPDVQATISRLFDRAAKEAGASPRATKDQVLAEIRRVLNADNKGKRNGNPGKSGLKKIFKEQLTKLKKRDADDVMDTILQEFNGKARKLIRRMFKDVRNQFKDSKDGVKNEAKDEAKSGDENEDGEEEGGDEQEKKPEQKRNPVKAQGDRDPSDHTTWGKVGRNEKCPCTSGKKFKQCCIAKVAL